MDDIYVRINIESHHFYELSPYYVYAFSSIPQRRRLKLEPLDINCMFKIYKLMRKDQFLGLAFRSAAHVLNGGAYLVSYMQKRRQKADASVTLMRTPDIVIYNYPNVGTLAVSPKVNPHLTTLLEEQ